MATIAKLVTELSLDDKFSQNIGKATSKLKSFGQTATNVGRSMTAKVTAPLVLAGTAAVKLSTDFDAAFTKLEALVGVPADEIDALKADVLKLAPAVGRAPLELAEALFFVTSAGIPAGKAMEVVEASGKAAAVGLGSAALVADLATSAMNAYGPSVVDANKATDILLATVREGKASPEELTAAFAAVIPTAAQMGLSFDQVGGALAGMTRVGIPASQAGTALNQVLVSLLKPTTQATDALESVGLSAGGLRRQIGEEGLVATLRTLETAFGDDEEAMAQVFGSVEALKGVFALLGLDSAELDAIFDNLAGSTGDLDKAFAKTAKDPAFRFAQAMARVKVALIQIGAAIVPVVLPAIEGLARAFLAVIGIFQRLPTPIRVVVFFLAGLLAALGPILIIVGAMASGLAALIPILSSLGAGLLPLLGPLALVVAALAAFGLAWQFNLFGVRDRVDEHVNDFIKVFNRLRDEGFSPVNAGIRAVGSALEDLTGIEMSAFFFRLAEIADILVLIGGAVIRQSIDDLRFALLLLPVVFDQIERDAEVAFDILRASVLLTATDVQVAFLILRASVAETIAILDRFGGALINVGLHLLGFGLGVSLAFLAAKAAIQLFLSDIATLATVGQGLFNVGVALAQSLIDGWVARIALFAVTLAILGQWALLTVGTVSAALFDAGVSLVQGLSDGFGAGSKLFAVTLAAVGIWAFAQVGTVSGALYEKGIDLVQGVIDGWVDAAKRLAVTLAGFGPWAAAQVGTLSGTLFGAGQSLVGGLTAGIIASLPGLQSAVSEINSIINGIIDFVDPRSPSHLMQPVGESIPPGLAVGIQRTMPQLSRAIGGVNAALGMPSARVPGINATVGMPSGAGGGPFYNYGTITVRANDPGEFMDALQAHDVGGARP